MAELITTSSLATIADAIIAIEQQRTPISYPFDFTYKASNIEFWAYDDRQDVVGVNNVKTTVASNTYRNNSITYVSFPAVNVISSHAFSGCANLLGATFRSMSYVPVGLFRGCSKLKQVCFPNCAQISMIFPTYSTSVSQPYNMNAFYGCDAIESIEFPELISITNGSVYNLNGQESIIGTFANLSLLRRVALPACSYVGSYAFANCTNLKAASLSACEELGGGAFYNCTQLQNIKLPACTIIKSAHKSQNGMTDYGDEGY